ncbi:MAG: hypothetical protein PHI85_11255 [Victivallaceae bacterium]|nr:hypothetical protein [Victivallaceae bacterium]
MKEIRLIQTQTVDELRQEVDIWYRTFVSRRYFVFVGFVVLAAGTIFAAVRDNFKAASLLGGAAVLFAFYTLFIQKKLAVTQVFNALRMSPIFGRETVIDITPGGTISISCNGYNGKHSLKDFSCAVETDRALLLFVNRSGWISLSRAAFPDRESYDELVHNIEIHSMRVMRRDNDGSKKSGR